MAKRLESHAPSALDYGRVKQNPRARVADKAITDAIDAHVDDERRDDDRDDGTTGALAPAG
ncbi:MAG TPA: hypothetical protein VG142_19145 [Trebonia sp.]|nr:hypothetical protein [Trebonia sp.]